MIHTIDDNTYKPTLNLSFFDNALASLEMSAFQPLTEDRISVDATTHRFKLAFNLWITLLLKILESKGVAVTCPKDVLQKAYQGHLIDNEKVWIKMLHDRNLTSHTYNEDLALEIFKNIQSYVPVFRTTFEALKQKV